LRHTHQNGELSRCQVGFGCLVGEQHLSALARSMQQMQCRAVEGTQAMTVLHAILLRMLRVSPHIVAAYADVYGHCDAAVLTLVLGTPAPVAEHKYGLRCNTDRFDRIRRFSAFRRMHGSFPFSAFTDG
jgi:hypothetical protein